jgi:hypothetical protein
MTDGMTMEQHYERNRWGWYEVQVEGLFNPAWFNWLDEWEITPLPNGNTLLAGPVIDQPALHGIFAHIRDMNLTIIFVKKIDQ